MNDRCALLARRLEPACQQGVNKYPVCESHNQVLSTQCTSKSHHGLYVNYVFSVVNGPPSFSRCAFLSLLLFSHFAIAIATHIKKNRVPMAVKAALSVSSGVGLKNLFESDMLPSIYVRVSTLLQSI